PIVIHGEHGREAADPDGRNRRRNRVRRILAPFTDRIITVSAQLRHWLTVEIGIPAAKVSVVRNGVDVARFQRRADRDSQRARFGFAPSDIVVGTAGRLDPVKDQSALLAALALLSTELPTLRVLIVGDGPEHANLRDEIATRGLGSRASL